MKAARLTPCSTGRPNAATTSAPKSAAAIAARCAELFQLEVSQWLREGRIRYREDVVDGLENAPEAFMGMLKGRHFGKLLVRITH